MQRQKETFYRVSLLIGNIRLFCSVLISLFVQGIGQRYLNQKFSAMMEQRFLKLAHDDIGMRDFAAMMSGANYIPSLTSPTYHGEQGATASPIYPRSFDAPSGSEFSEGSDSNVRRIKQTGGMPPQTALIPGTVPGQCWRFSGSYGHLGISLPEPIVVTHVTVDHTPYTMAPNTSMAPRDIKFWGLLSQKLYSDVYQQYVQHSGRPYPYPTPALASLASQQAWMLLTNVTYNVSSPFHIQTFDISAKLTHLRIPLETIVIEIENNWGDAPYTCLYRVRIHSNL